MWSIDFLPASAIPVIGNMTAVMLFVFVLYTSFHFIQYFSH